LIIGIFDTLRHELLNLSLNQPIIRTYWKLGGAICYYPAFYGQGCLLQRPITNRLNTPYEQKGHNHTDRQFNWQRN
jgi:hypothetical protein